MAPKYTPASPVINWRSENNIHYLHTPNGIVKTKTVVVATAGYTSTNLHQSLAYRYMPILSNAVVTRTLTQQEIDVCNLKTHLLMTDSRKLRFYYRFLPDKRIHIGSRSAITGANAEHKKHYDLLRTGLRRKFPALAQIEIDYSWWGWLDISHDMMPRVTADKQQQIFYASGYSGNGVAFSAYAGYRTAEKIVGKSLEYDDLPLYNSFLPKHPLTPFRRLGQRALFGLYYLQDEVLSRI